MSTRTRFYSGLLLLIICGMIPTLLFYADPGQAQDSDPSATPTMTWTPLANYVLPDDVNIRSGPARSYLAIGQLVRGNTVLPVARSVDGTWVLIRYRGGSGWIRGDLVSWVDNINALPVMAAGVTPTINPADYTATPFFPTDTPPGNWANVNAQGAYLRAGPGRTYLVMGALHAGDMVEPVARIEDGSWVMIRREDGFAWVRVDLVRWFDDLDALPVIPTDDPDLLTPSLTFTPSITVSATATPTGTRTPTSTYTPSHTPTTTYTPSATPTASATLTPTPTLTATDTGVPPSDTPQPTATDTPVPPSDTPQPTATPTATDTDVPPSDTPQPTATDTETAEAALVVTDTAPASSPTHAAPPTFTPLPSPAGVDDTPEPTATDTELPPSDTPEPVPTDTPQPTAVVAAAVDGGNGSDDGNAPPTGDGGNAPLIVTPFGELPRDYLLGGLAGVVIVLYLLFYAAGAANANRYAGGFVIETCPVCQKGQLNVVNRHRRGLGIPRVRRTVHCDYCGSVLRQVGRGRWRYTVDGGENPDLFTRYNGNEITDAALIELGETNRYQMVAPPPEDYQPPQYVDDDPDA